MRIRHPRFDSPIQSPSTTNEMRKQLLNSSQGSSFKMTDSQHSKSRQSSPRLSSADGHVSSLSGMSESLDDPTNVYLNPDFTDPQLMANTDSVGPSPLALLARTCQNIGNIMDCGVVSNRFISPITNSTRKQSTACSLPVANSKIVNNSNSLSKSIKPKGIIVSEATSSLVAKRNVTSKYFSVADLSKMNSSTFGGSDPVNSISSSVVKASRMSDSVENPSTSYQSTARQSSPISSPSNLFPHTNSAKLDSSIAFNNNFLKADDMHQTSNALAQLARLSSSFSLPETPKLNFTNLKSSTNSADNRNPWNDINNGINSGNMQHDTHSLKRMKRRANSTSKFPSIQEECTSPSSAKKYMKDNYYPSFLNPMNLYINSRDSDNSQCELDNSLGINISPNMTTNMMNNPSHSPNLSSLFKYNEHLQSYKETTNVMNDKNTQEKFSYQLARSFLDFFYGKLASSMNPELDNCLNIQNNSLYKENNHDTTNQSYLDNGGRSMEWLANTSLSNRRQTSEQLNSTVNQTPLTSFNTFPCLLCGQVFHSHTELSMHVYTHIMTLNFHGARKSNHQMEQVLRFLHSEHYQTRDRPNGLLSEQVNSDSFSPLFVPPPPPPLLPPPPPPPVMATSVNNMPTTCSAAQTCPISESSSPSDPMYLFHTYLSQWLTSFSNPNSNYRPSDTTNYNHITNASWTPGSPMPNKSAEYRNLQGILTAYLCSLKESASTASVVSEASGDIPSTRGLNSANLPSIPLQHSLHKTENSSYYDILFGSKPYITPFPQS